MTQFDPFARQARVATFAAPLPIRPRRPRRLATAVIEDLANRVVSGELPVGATLPTEPALCDAYGVSRTVVREAIKALESMRLVSAQQGAGTTVRSDEDWDLVDSTVLEAVARHDSEHTILQELVDVRRALESQLAGQAATKATDEQRAALTAQLHELGRHVDDEEAYLAADRDFHETILLASGNRLGRAVVANLAVDAYRNLPFPGRAIKEHLRLTHEAHQKVHDAIQAKDATKATKLMDQLILEAWERRRPTTKTRGRRTSK